MKRRSPGRPKAGEDQREGLLDAALACYVSQGIRGTSLRDIAAKAGVTPALVHYYFGDGETLLHAVVQHKLLPVFGALRASLQASDDNPAALVTAFVDAIIGAIESHPWWPALWVREVISEGGSLRTLVTRTLVPQLVRGLSRRLAGAQAKGLLNPRLDPRLLVVSVVGLTLFPAAGAPIWRQILAANELSMGEVRSHALALLLDGMRVKS